MSDIVYNSIPNTKNILTTIVNNINKDEIYLFECHPDFYSDQGQTLEPLSSVRDQEEGIFTEVRETFRLYIYFGGTHEESNPEPLEEREPRSTHYATYRSQ